MLYGEEREIREVALASTLSFNFIHYLNNFQLDDELKDALKHFSSGKAPGSDSIPANFLKCDPCIMSSIYELMCKCWQAGRSPAIMKDAKIVNIKNGQRW